MNVIVLGGGLVGSAIVRDLARESSFTVSVADISHECLDGFASDPRIGRLQADLSDPAAVRDAVRPFDLVIGAVPGFMGFQTVRAAIEAGKNLVDISFFPENAFELDGLAREHGVTAVVDCGLAPGLSNILMGRVDGMLDETTRFLCYVGGLPVVRKKPYEYAAVFSPIDVIEEYTRPARYIEGGREVILPALTDVEQLHFDGVGTLEAFNTDGLRTLAVTMHAPDMKEKTMRYPGHSDLMRIFRDSGFFSKVPLDISGNSMRPLDMTAKLLFPLWKLGQGEEDMSIMRVIIEGIKDGRQQRYTYEMLDRFDRTTGTTSMARTTGYTCAVAARLVASGRFNRIGICPAEYLGQDAAVYESLMKGLAERGVLFRESRS